MTTVTNLSPVLGTSSSIDIDGEYTVELSAAAQYGQYENGNYWIVGPVTLNDVVGADGGMINPRSDESMGFGPRPEIEKGWSYSAANDITQNYPIAVSTGESIVMAQTQVFNFPDQARIRDLRVAHVVDTIPWDDSFSPPYTGSTKYDYTWRDVDEAALNLQNYPLVGVSPDIDAIIAQFDHPWYDAKRGWSARFIHPEGNMPDYGREMAGWTHRAAAMLHFDYPIEKKRTLLKRLIQLGLDYIGCRESHATDELWFADGGHPQGRKLPILIAGIALQNQTFIDYCGGVGRWAFGEDEQTYFIGTPGPTTAHWAVTPDRRDGVTLSDWGQSYQQCCTAKVWWGSVFFCREGGHVAAYNHDQFFWYMDRYVAEPSTVGDQFWGSFEQFLYTQYG